MISPEALENGLAGGHSRHSGRQLGRRAGTGQLRAHQVRCLLSLEQGSPAMNLTMKTVATLDNLARELSAIAEALYSAGYVVEYSLLNSAATLTASVSRNVEGKIETYARAALSEQKDRRP